MLTDAPATGVSGAGEGEKVSATAVVIVGAALFRSGGRAIDIAIEFDAEFGWTVPLIFEPVLNKHERSDTR